MKNSVLRVILCMIVVCLFIPMKAQKYQNHIHLANRDVTAKALTRDKQDNLFLLGKSRDALNLSGNNEMKRIPLNMMSYNIKGSIMNSSKLNKIAEVINVNTPDVVSIQEIDMTASYFTHDWLADLAKATGMKGFFFPLVGTHYGIALLAKEDPIKVTNKKIKRGESSSDREDRGMIIAEFEKYVFIATHYSLNAEDRDNATEFIVDYALGTAKNVFVAGDMNALCTYRCIKTFLDSGFKILNDTSVPTFSAANPTKCIDMILGFSPEQGGLPFAVAEAGIANQSSVDLTRVSDHLPIYVKAEMLENISSHFDLSQVNEGVDRCYLAKYDKNQKLVWFKELTVEGEITPYNIRTDANGNVYIAAGFNGAFAEDSFLKGNGKGSCFVKLDNSGNVLWSRFLGNQYANNQFADICPDSNNGFYITTDFTGQLDIDESHHLSTQGTGCFIARFSQDAHCLWAKRIDPGNMKKAFTHRIVAGNDDDVYMAFVANGLDMSIDEKKVIGSVTAFCSYISRWDNAGDLCWFKKIKGLGYKSNAKTQRNVSCGPCADAIPMDVDADNNISFVLWTSGMRLEIASNSSDTDDIIDDVSLGEGLAKAGIMWLKFSEEGNKLSSVCLGNNEKSRTSPYEYLMSPVLFIDGKGNNYVGGFSTSEDYAYTSDYKPCARGREDFFIARINSKNEIDFVRRVGGRSDDFVSSIVVSSDNNRLFTTIDSKSSPSFLGLNLAEYMDEQNICVTENITSSNIYFTSYIIDDPQSGISEKREDFPFEVIPFKEGICVKNVKEPCLLFIYTSDGTLIKKIRVSKETEIPLTHSDKLLFLKAVSHSQSISKKIFFKPQY